MADKIVSRLQSCRNEAMQNVGRRDFAKQTRYTERYLAGKQVPESLAGQAEQGDYRVVNFEADLTDRVTAMLSGGRTPVHMRASGDYDEILIDACRWLFDEEMRQVHFPGIIFEWIHDAVAYNVGAVRAFFDPSRLIERGGYIGLENIHPLSIWISPFARDPYHPLLGSDYIGYETLYRRRDLVRMYPDKARKINSLSAYNRFQNDEGEDDPVSPLLGGIADGGESTQSGADQWRKSGTTSMNEDEYNKSAKDLIRVIEFEYEDAESIPVGPDGESPASISGWRRVVVAGECNGAGSDTVVLEDDEQIPYGIPTITLIILRRTTDSQYGNGGLPTRVHDLQDAFNVLFSVRMKEMQEDSVWSQIRFAKAGVLDPSDKNNIMGPASKPRIIEIDPDNEYPDRDINDLIGRLREDHVDWQASSQALGEMAQLMRTVYGVSSAVIGDAELKRTSGIALHSAQQAVLVAQEAARQHINAGVTNIANLLWQMIRYHWIVPQRVLSGDGTSLEINLRMPVIMTDEQGNESMQALEAVQALIHEARPELKGKPFIPGALHIPLEDGDEEVIPLTDEQAVEAVLSGGAGFTPQQIAESEFSFNYLPALELEIDMEVESDDVERNRQKREAMQWAAQANTGFWSWETLASNAMNDDPKWTPDLERRRLYGNQIAQVLRESQQLEQMAPGAQQMLMNVIQQTIQQIMQQAQSGQPLQGGPQAGGQQAGGVPAEGEAGGAAAPAPPQQAPVA